MMPYCNNLKKGDPVQDSASGRKGTVFMQPSEVARRVSVLWEGIKTARYEPILSLRLIVDGRPEDVPPINGELPPAYTPVRTKSSEDPEEQHLKVFSEAARILAPLEFDKRARIVRALAVLFNVSLP